LAGCEIERFSRRKPQEQTHDVMRQMQRALDAAG